MTSPPDFPILQSITPIDSKPESYGTLGESLQIHQILTPLAEASDSVSIRPQKRVRIAVPTADTGSESERICDGCSGFDFESIFNPSKTPHTHGRPIRPQIHAIATAAETSTCPLCRLFAAVRFPREITVANPSGRYHLRCWSTLRMYGLASTKARTALKPGVVIAIEQGNPVKRFPSAGYMMPYGAIAPVVSNPSQLRLERFSLFGSLVDAKTVNFSQVRKWLRNCDAQHADVCKAPVTYQLDFLRVLDCDTMKIVPTVTLPSDVQYFALSYVWGRPNSNSDTGDAGSPYRTQLLFSKLPQMIRDAIKVVKNLTEEGRRYLWIDKYCIDQNDPRDKAIQIGKMDRIYEGAFATIVAASGDGAHCGLPGVGLVSRVPQPVAFASGKQLVSTLPHVSIALQDTKWVTRGWTYQEAILSRRCLVFTDLQVYFICQISTCCEAMHKSDDLRSPSNRLPYALYRPQVPVMRRIASIPQEKGVLEQFSTHVEQYTRREFTHDTDALDGFKGILARSPFHSYWGIPIVNLMGEESIDTDFATGLAWVSYRFGKHLHRRTGLPSWSWVGWAGSIHFRTPPINLASFGITFWAEPPGADNQELVPLKTLWGAAGDTKVIAEVSPVLHVEGYMVKLWFQRPYSTNLDRELHPGRYVFFCWQHLSSECQCRTMFTFGSTGRGLELYPRDCSDGRVFGPGMG